MQASVLVADSDGHPVRAALTTNRDDRLAKVAIFPADRTQVGTRAGHLDVAPRSTVRNLWVAGQLV